jgi:hypothetical protein
VPQENYRQNCRFYLLSGGAQFALVEAQSNVVKVMNHNYPRFVCPPVSALSPLPPLSPFLSCYYQ